MPDNAPSQGQNTSANSTASQSRGKHKVFLGFAHGVGKTYAMLDEAQRRKSRGQNLVIGVVDFRNRPATEEMAKEMESVALKTIQQGDKTFHEMDVDAILSRKPDLVLVDDLAHTNVPGAERQHRWEDVQILLDNGINVLSTLNIQNLESLNDHIADITGHKEEETIPDRVLQEADEVELVDLTPRALLNRLERGDVFTTEDDLVGAKWFTEGNLSALRELALREIAERVDEDVLEFRKEKGIKKPWATHDRVMICISPSRPSLRLIRRGWRTAQRLRADVVAVYVEDAAPPLAQQKILDDDFRLCERLGVKVEKLNGNVAQQLVKYARENNITEIVIGHSSRTRVQELLHGSIIATLTRELRTIDILVVANDSEPDAGSGH